MSQTLGPTCCTFSNTCLSLDNAKMQPINFSDFRIFNLPLWQIFAKTKIPLSAVTQTHKQAQLTSCTSNNFRSLNHKLDLHIQKQLLQISSLIHKQSQWKHSHHITTSTFLIFIHCFKFWNRSSFTQQTQHITWQDVAATCLTSWTINLIGSSA